MTTTTAEVITRKVSVGEYEFSLGESGEAGMPAVLFLHGSGPGATGMSNWEAVIGDLGDRYHCLAPDVIGFGDSTHPDPPPQGIRPFTELRIETLFGLLDELGIDRVNLVGNSMGGMYSLGMVRDKPERIDKIVMMGTGGGHVAAGPELGRLSGFYENPTTESMAALLRAFVYDPAMFGDSLNQIAEARMPRASRPDVRRSHLATFDWSDPWQFSEEDLAAITQEVLVIHGREDKMVLFESGLYAFERIPHARIVGLGQCGHWTQIEQRKRFVFLVDAFLRGDL